MPTCIFCDFYNHISEELRKSIVISATKKEYMRYCRHVEDDVDSETASCKHFVPYPYFWCDTFNYRLHLLQCLHRQKIRLFGCANCSQGQDDIMDVARGRDLYELFGVDRKIHLQNKKQEKPKLRRRKA